MVNFYLDNININYYAMYVFINNKEIKLIQTEYNIVALLSEHLGKILTYNFIIKEILGYNDLGRVRTMLDFIKNNHQQE